MAASVEGTATCSPALQTLSLMQARHTISPPISISVWAPVSNEKQFATYFKEDYRSFCVGSRSVCVHSNELSIDMQEQLIELKSDSRLKELFSSCPLSSFWAALMQEYPELCDVALKILLPFASTYLCEAGFSRQSRLRSHINITYLQASVKKCKWCLLLGLVIITIIKHKLISEVWCQFPIIAKA